MLWQGSSMLARQLQGTLQGSFGCKKLRKYIIVFSTYFSILSLAPLSTAPLDSKALARYLARHLCMAKSRGRVPGDGYVSLDEVNMAVWA